MGNERDSRIDTLIQLGSAYHDAARYAEMVAPLEEALSLTVDEPSLRRSTILANLGVAHRHMDDIPTAMKYLNEAMEGFQAIPDRSPDSESLYAGILNNLGGLHRTLRNFSQAGHFLKEGLDILMKRPGLPGERLAAAHFSLALLRMDLGDYPSAKPHLDDALSLTRDALGTMNVTYAVELNALATWNHHTGNLASAVRLHEEVTEIYKQIYGKEHPNYATNLTGLAGLYGAVGWHRKAEIALREAASILEARVGRNHHGYLECIVALSVTLYRLRNYQEAEALASRALTTIGKALGRDNPLYSACLHNLVMFLPNMSANGLIDALIEFLELDEARPTLQDSIAAFFALDRNELQLALLKKVAAVEVSIGMENRTSYSTTLTNIGTAYADRGNFEESETYLRRALEIERKQGYDERPELSQRLSALALVVARTGRPLEAMELMQEANEIDSRVMAQVFATGSESQRMQYLAELRRNFHIFLSLVVHQLSDQPAAVREAFDLTLQRKAIGAEALAAQRDAILSGRYPQLALKLEELRDLRARIARKTLSGFGAKPDENGWQQIFAWNDRKELLETELARHISEIALEHQLSAADWRAVSAMLPRSSRLIEFVQFGDFDPSTVESNVAHYLAFVVSPGDSTGVELVDLGRAEPINRLIGDFREATIGVKAATQTPEPGRPCGRDPACGYALGELVFFPLIPYLQGATRVYLATDGDLTRLPFEALPLGEARVAIDRYELSYLNSGRDLIRFNQRTVGKPTAPLVVADPDFEFACDDLGAPPELGGVGDLSRDFFNADLHFDRLRGTRIEGEAVAKLLNVAPLLDRAAVEQTIKTKTSPSVLHIATHGFFFPDQHSQQERSSRHPFELSAGEWAQIDQDSPHSALENPLQRSGLALAGVNRTLRREGGLPAEAEDGILTAEDVTAMDLVDTELVVLSACETGLGKVVVGEGVYGLQRAFVLAGAKTLIMSLWKVPDKQTQELMSDFYRRLLDGVPRAEALRLAQRALKERYAEPFYWAAFICQGDPSPLKNRWSIKVRE
jgi:CHAT domain-containing protein/tetratricopeptide (TPR) repeat protein